MVVVSGDHNPAISPRLLLLQDPQRVLCHHPVALRVQLVRVIYVLAKLDILEQNMPMQTTVTHTTSHTL